jgi:hypothetical protein
MIILISSIDPVIHNSQMSTGENVQWLENASERFGPAGPDHCQNWPSYQRKGRDNPIARAAFSNWLTE